ncbi:MAG: hypothetical protein PHJ00_00425 [Candidatus Omnitrophica bacterium]|nr:hypothetical protein [Candidatus Omnitrophota bacterium]
MAKRAENGCFFAFRDLTHRDISGIRRGNIKKITLPLLLQQQSEDFFRDFDIFWDEVTRGKNTEHVFWRTALSSKMQPLDNSVGYLCLVLFTLARMNIRDKVIILVNSLEMKKAVLAWANTNKWKVDPASYFENGLLLKLKDRAGRIICLLRMLAYCLWKKTSTLGISLPKTVTPGGRPKVLITSMMYFSSIGKDGYRDPFFNDLHLHIGRKGYEVTYLCDMLDNYGREAVKRASLCRDAQVLPLFLLLGYTGIMKAFWRMCSRKIGFSGCFFGSCDLSGLLLWESGSFNSFNMTAELFYTGVKKILKDKKYDKVITKFEGNVNERACIQAAREAGVARIIGYVHTVMYEYHLKIRLTRKESLLKPGPDEYICVGPYSKELFLRIGREYKEASVKSGYMIKRIPRAIGKNDRKEKNVLVVLDGISIANTAAVLDWIFTAAQNAGDESFIVRFHPNISKDRALKQCVNTGPGNVAISNNSLERDLSSCKCVLYRHSQLGIEALLNRVPVVYMNINSPLLGDPLQGLDRWKYSVSSADELPRVLDKITKESESRTENEYENARDFLDNYFKIPPEDPSEDFMR